LDCENAIKISGVVNKRANNIETDHFSNICCNGVLGNYRLPRPSLLV